MRSTRDLSSSHPHPRRSQNGNALRNWGLFLFLLPLFAAALWSAHERSLRKDDFSHAAECGKCHERIYRQWKRSMHASSFSDPVYRAVFERMIAGTGRRNQIFCLSCHAPIATATGSVLSHPTPLKWDGFDPLSVEGVTCDFCHTIAANPALRGRILIGGYQIADDGQSVKFGIHNASNRFHPVRRSELLTHSEFCATCHSFKHPVLATEIQNTYEEWRASSYAEKGVQCQDCHMPGSPEEPDDEPGSTMPRSHGIEGGRGPLIERALSLKVDGEIERSAGERLLRVTATIRNVGAGHRVPTGIPGIRELWLKLDVRDGENSLATGRFSLSQRLIDENGKEALPWEAYALIEDLRLEPERTVEKKLEVPLLSGVSGRLQISGQILYRMVSDNVSKRLDLPSEPPIRVRMETIEVESR